MAKTVIVKPEPGENLDAVDLNQALGKDEGKAVGKKKVKKLSAADVVSSMMRDIADVKNAPKVSILIHSGGGKDGGEPVFVAVNGTGYLIPRDKVVSVPEPILSALEEACETRYHRAEVDGKIVGPVIARQVPRFAINHR